MSKKGGHHGGAWKVAYADFVTAMMALFMVLWLAAQDQKIKEAVERAFRNPFMSLTKESAGLMPNKDKNSGSSSSSSSSKFDTSAASAMELAMLRRLQQDMVSSLAKRVEEDDDTVKFNLTPDGLRINIFDRARKPIFEPDSDRLTDYGVWILTTLAWEISRYKDFAIELEGHTERGRAAASKTYGDWELSTDRANSGRRKLLEHGVGNNQVIKVAGFADTNPLPGTQPQDVVNRRITLMLKVQSDKTSK